MSQKLQPLSQIVSLEDLPEIFGFLTSPIEDLLSNLKIVQLKSQSYFSLNLNYSIGFC